MSTLFSGNLAPSHPQIPSRALTEEDRVDAKAMMGGLFWAPPVIFTVGYFAGAWFALPLGWEGEAICLLMLGGLASWGWISSVAQYRRYTRDLGTNLVYIVEGTPERVTMSRFGRCYVRFPGRKIRISNADFSELRDANNVKIEYLPESRIAVRANIVRGVGR